MLNNPLTIYPLIEISICTIRVLEWLLLLLLSLLQWNSDLKKSKEQIKNKKNSLGIILIWDLCFQSLHEFIKGFGRHINFNRFSIATCTGVYSFSGRSIVYFHVLFLSFFKWKEKICLLLGKAITKSRYQVRPRTPHALMKYFQM